MKGKNSKYDFAIKHTTDSVLQILLQDSRWRVKTANMIGKYPAMAEKLKKLRMGKKKYPFHQTWFSSALKRNSVFFSPDFTVLPLRFLFYSIFNISDFADFRFFVLVKSGLFHKPMMNQKTAFWYKMELETKSHYKLILIVISTNKKNMLWYLYALQKKIFFFRYYW